MVLAEVAVVGAVVREGAPGHLAFDVGDVHHLDGAGEGIPVGKSEVLVAEGEYQSSRELDGHTSPCGDQTLIALRRRERHLKRTLPRGSGRNRGLVPASRCLESFCSATECFLSTLESSGSNFILFFQ